ncbi:MAG: hypothetical protein DRH06_00350 [Deltaproteobacteria bacterium]|nr:MAG: hypothetical protein DRH06_00350 [Deltaproteobacteria bacterium]
MTLRGSVNKNDVVEIEVRCNTCGKSIIRHINKKFLRADGTTNQSSYCPVCSKERSNLYRGSTSDQIKEKRTMESSGCRKLDPAEIAAVEAQYSKVELSTKRDPLTYYRELRY